MSAESAMTSSSLTLAAIADAALGRQFVLAVLGAPRVDDLERTVVADQGKGEVNDAVDTLDLFEQAGRVVRQCGGSIEILVDLIEKAQIGGHAAPPSQLIFQKGRQSIPPTRPAEAASPPTMNFHRLQPSRRLRLSN